MCVIYQKRAPELIIDGCKSQCVFWEFNSGHLEEQRVLLTILNEPSLQSPGFSYSNVHRANHYLFKVLKTNKTQVFFTDPNIVPYNG